MSGLLKKLFMLVLTHLLFAPFYYTPHLITSFKNVKFKVQNAKLMIFYLLKS